MLFKIKLKKIKVILPEIKLLKIQLKVSLKYGMRR